VDAQTAYNLLLLIAQCPDSALYDGYRQLRSLLEDCCREEIAGSGLQQADLAARINYVAGKRGLDLHAQHRLHTFRLTSNALLNHQQEPVKEELLRDVKTMAFFIKVLTGVNIPSPLQLLLPKADATYSTAPPALRKEKLLRVTFLYKDKTFLYVRPHDVLYDKPLKVSYNLPQYNDEFNETCAQLWSNATLHLLDVGFDAEGILTPSLIVLEPDYLLDISSLAECFKEYGHHPGNYFLNRLTPKENKAHLIKGNIANLFLDEWVFDEQAPDYQPSMQKAFRQYPLELVTCPDLDNGTAERKFFEECREQFENIRQTVQVTFHATGYQLETSDAVLEPSYICIPLGIQGRLDYMQRDMSSFIELKSGKAEEYKVPGRLLLKENHQVQMQLYQAVLEYSMGQDHHHTHPFLFYSHYPLLYPARPSWALLRRALNLRNLIVATEYQVQKHNDIHFTAHFLESLTADQLHQQEVNANFWNKVAPTLGWLQQALAHSTELERSYFLSVYNFITKELYTSKSGDTLYESNRGASILWLSTIDEKAESGEIITGLKIADNQSAREHKATVTFQRPQDETGNGLPNFREGDAVLFYQFNDPADNATNQLVFKGNIERMDEQSLCVRLRMRQRNPRILPEESTYTLEHDFMDTAFTTMYKGLSAFLLTTQSRRDLLLGQRPPLHDAAFDTQIAAATDDFQRICLKAQAAQDYFLLVGPPGTGKTSYALRNMVQAFHQQGKQLLLLSYTNRAVDEICKMLESIVPTPDYIRLGGELNCEETYRPHLLENVLGGLNNRKAVRARLEACSLFVGTVSTLSKKQELFALKKFDVALIDEATQILEPQLLGILCAKTPKGKEAIGKFILIGDPKQLPAVVLQDDMSSEINEACLRQIGMRNLKDSLFDRLYQSVDDPYCFDMLCKQGRMNVDVSHFANQAFYEGRLLPVGLPHQQGSLSVAPGLQGIDMARYLDRRIAFLPAKAEPILSSPKRNHAEAQLAARLARALFKQYCILEDFIPQKTLGIITPYRSQIALIRQALNATGIPQLCQITVDTVERYQGSERDVIIYSFCANRPSQLRFLANLTNDHGVLIDRKLNVAITRARKQLFLIGVPEVLSQNPIYAKLMEWAGY